MLSFLLRILAFVWILWIVRRFLAMLVGQPSQKKNRPKPDGSPTGMVKDPVCGMYMDPALAIRERHQSEDLFFCSEECRHKYEERKG